MLQGTWVVGYGWESTVLCFWTWKALGWVGNLWQRGGGGVWQESTQDGVAWGEVVEVLCFRKMGNVM